MALPIQGIPTLYGEEARRFRDMADEAEIRFLEREKKYGPRSESIKKDPGYIAMLEILKNAGWNKKKEEDEKLSYALKMKAKGYPLEDIAEISGLSIDEIENL